MWSVVLHFLCVFGCLQLRAFGKIRYATYPNEISENIVDIDHDLVYGEIRPFHDEWASLYNFNESDPKPPATISFWFRCVNYQVRGYYFIEDLTPLSHSKEAIIVGMKPIIKKNLLKIFADGEPIRFAVSNGGGDLYFNISSSVPKNHVVDITIPGFKHFTHFPVSACINDPSYDIVADGEYNLYGGKQGSVGGPPSEGSSSSPMGTQSLTSPSIPKTERIMHIHLKEFWNNSATNLHIVEGIARHMHYHFCALDLHRYEVVVAFQQVDNFLANVYIRAAVAKGWLRLLVRHLTLPAPMRYLNKPTTSTCYYQAYTQNLCLLHYWKRRAKVFFFDSDEYINFSDALTTSQFQRILDSHSVVGFDRRMTFCAHCPRHDPARPEISYLSFNDNTPDYSKGAAPNSIVSAASDSSDSSNSGSVGADPVSTRFMQMQVKLKKGKLAVDPNRVGCFIIHYVGCGVRKPLMVGMEVAYIMHFENLYATRFKLQVGEAGRGLKLQLSESNRKLDYNLTKVNRVCDPSLMDASKPIPRYHLLH